MGGLAWVAACLVHDSLPQGCIDAGCTDRAMRDSTTAGEVLVGVAGLMLAASGVSLLLLARAARGGLGATGVAAAVAGVVGLTLLLAAGVMSSFVDSDWSGMPGLVVPGMGLLAVAMVLVTGLVLRAGVLPTWVSVLLVVAALLLLFANEQTSRILLAVPFGLTWGVAGVLLLRRSRGSRQVPGTHRTFLTRSS